MCVRPVLKDMFSAVPLTKKAAPETGTAFSFPQLKKWFMLQPECL